MGECPKTLAAGRAAGWKASRRRARSTTGATIPWPISSSTTSAPVSVGVRAWSPFLPGDVTASMIPGAVFEVHLRNMSGERRAELRPELPRADQEGSRHRTFRREDVHGPVEGRAGQFGQQSRARPSRRRRPATCSACSGQEKARFGGALDAGGWNWGQLSESPWARIHEKSAARRRRARVEHRRRWTSRSRPARSVTVRFVLAWHSPMWRGGGHALIEAKATGSCTCTPCTAARAKRR